jgi:hypothetical protein
VRISQYQNLYYREDGDAWSAFPHEHARSRVFRWVYLPISHHANIKGEDGIGGFSDTHQYMCTSFAFWNERDPILKERLFGVTGHQGTHLTPQDHLTVRKPW